MGDDRLLLPTRLASIVVAAFLVTAGGMLLAFPERTEQLWAWPIDPPLSALAIGGGYLAGAVLFVRGLFAGRWHQLAVGFVAATVLSALLLIATVVHWDAFTHGHVSFWSWAVLYAAAPFALPVLWALNRRRDPGRGEGPTVGAATRRVVGVAGGAMLAIALLIFTSPAAVADAAPWTLAPLVARTIGAFMAFLAVVGLAFLVEERWSALQLHVEGATVGLALVGVGALRSLDDLTGPAWTIAVFAIALAGAVAGLVWLQVAMRVRSAEQPAPRSAGLDA